MKLEDVVTIRYWLDDFDPYKVTSSNNMFSGKNIGRKENDNGNNSTNVKMEVSPLIK